MKKRNVSVILLYNDKKEVLLQHRSEDSPTLAGYWAFFGGGIEAGENPEEAVKRETIEELNYQLKGPQKVMTQNFIGEVYEGVKYVFIEKYDSSQKLELHEGQGMKWVKISNTKEMKIIDHDREVLEFVENNILK
ncbi:MAG: NUDIX domain-containing protein [Patescibacteria group bacterium]|jgi:A/G-specific adenine glycosylase